MARLSVLTCGALPVNAANLLSGTRMRVLLAELQEQFDIIVLDTPPVLATADASIVASLTDGVLLVVRAGTTDKNAAQRAYQQLANVGARVVGTVLNDPGWRGRQGGRLLLPVRLRRAGAVIAGRTGHRGQRRWLIAPGAGCSSRAARARRLTAAHGGMSAT